MMNSFTTRDGVRIHYDAWGSGPPIVFSHGWPLTADAFEDQMYFFARRGYRVVAHDRRGHGRSDRPYAGNDMDTYADDLAQLVAHLGLVGVTHIGHGSGGGEIARYIGRHGTQRVARVALISSVPPLMLRTPTNPVGQPVEVFDALRAHVTADRAAFFRDFSLPFYGYNRQGATVSQGVRDGFWRQAMMAGFPACHDGIGAFAETDFSADLGRIDVPALILHGDDDQVVPIEASARHCAQAIRDSLLTVYVGGGHGLGTTQKDRVNADLWAFVSGAQSAASG